MAEVEGETLESWLNKATNPANRQEDWEYIIGFCDQVNKELEGPQIAVRLLAHKIQSPQEWEAVQALTVLEACMKNCGRRFHNEYLGDRVSEKVKTKVIELLYSWTVALPEETKIKDAYQMLKKQGILQHDPQIPVDKTLIPSPPTRPKNAVFEDDEKSKLLARLLKSKNPEDLQEANKLIKNMVKEDEARMQKITKRLNTLEEVNNNVRLLNEMLAHYSTEESTEGDKELMTELYDRCEKMRRTLFKLASETEDNDNSLGEILQASDDLSRAINSYKKIVQGQAVNGELDLPELSRPQVSSGATNTETLIDLAGLDVPSVKTNSTAAPVFPIIPPPPYISSDVGSRTASQSNVTKQAPSSIGLLDVELLSLGLNDPPSNADIGEDPGESQWTSFQMESAALNPFNMTPGPDATSSTMTPLLQSVPRTFNQPTAQSFLAFPGVSPAPPALPLLPNPASISSVPRSNPIPLFPGAPLHSSSSTPTSISSGMLELDMLGQKLLEEVKSASRVSGTVSGLPQSAVTAGSAQPGSGYCTPSAAPGSPLLRSLSPQPSSPLRSGLPDMSLNNVLVPLETIKPSSVLPVTAYDKNGFRILLHFAKDCPPSRSDVLVIVISMISTSPLPITNVVLQAAVPKTMKVKLQPPSGTDLAPFNPVLPPAAITQVMLLANPLKERVRLRYKLTFTMGQRPCLELAEVDQFPPAEKWGSL
ncbi:ADP-ribosylation factor-binding protein GGA3 isoform X2 [Heptranchias perlo]|uniref:ADP-ribosylation factor-binding protein GGA3 isoform X2 n=2 Tax=Heptranchias perlo TaxID=212740 RepID=UPI003559DF80